MLLLSTLLTLMSAPVVRAQTLTPATRPDGTSIDASAVLATILNEARNTCVPITSAQFTEMSVELAATRPEELLALIAHLGLDHGPTTVIVTTTPGLAIQPTPGKLATKSPPTDVVVNATISINTKSRIATMTGRPSPARNAINDAGGDIFKLAQWDGAQWAPIGKTFDRIDAPCRIGWIAPDAKTFFASGDASPVFHSPGWRTAPWPTWKVRLPEVLPRGWYRLTTRISIAGTPGPSYAGATFRVP